MKSRDASIAAFLRNHRQRNDDFGCVAVLFPGDLAWKGKIESTNSY
jgi:hypothetical protein